MGIHHLWWLIPTVVLAGGIAWSLSAETVPHPEPVPAPASFLEDSLLGVCGGAAELSVGMATCL